MRHCIDTLLVGGEAVEIIVVNDGSADNTPDIAEEYERKYPEIVSVVHQANKGHGGAINAGLAKASGIFVKIVDSDDWVDAESYKKIIGTITSFSSDSLPDAIISNYVYEKLGKRRKTVISYSDALPEGRVFTWDEAGQFRLGRYMLMHALIYRREVLRKSGLVLPENTFYVDNIYAYTPLAYVETMCYINVNFYRYFIGREGQSVQEKTMMKRIDQQLAVNKLMIESVNLSDIANNKKRRYLMHYLEIVTAISSILLLKEGSRTSVIKRDGLWQYIKAKDAVVYGELRKSLVGRILHLRTPIGRLTAIAVYKISRMIVGFS